MNKQPNILWILTDQHKFNLFSCLDGPEGLTPNLEKLADDGVLFTNAYTPSPVCGPARACLKTGKFPASNGAIHNWVPFNKNNKYLPDMLKQVGYETGMAGKLHFFPPTDDYGFDKAWLSDAPYSVYWEDDKHSKYIKWLKENHFDKKGIDPVELFNEDELAYETDLRKFIMGSDFRTEEEHETNWTTKCTIEFLNKRNKSKPFFFYTSYFGPHQPYEAPSPYKNFYTANDITLPKSYYTDYHKNDPVFEGNSREIFNHINASLTEQDVKELVAANYNQIRMIDDYIGDIIEELTLQNCYDNTFIIFTSDHGDHLGEHGMFFKGQMYDSCVKVPLIIKPCNSCKGTINTKVVNTIDLYQTLLELANADKLDDALKQENVQSRSLLPILFDEDSNWDNKAFSVYGKNCDNLLTMLRIGDYKLMRLAKGNRTDAVYELYDMKANADETNNVYNDLKYKAICEKLKPELDEWFEKQYDIHSLIK